MLFIFFSMFTNTESQPFFKRRDDPHSWRGFQSSSSSLSLSQGLLLEEPGSSASARDVSAASWACLPL
jgi:hypothetical protein